MKKIFTLLIVAVMAAFVGVGKINAQYFYPKDHINQNFDGLTALPAGWSVISDNKGAAFGKNGGAALANDALHFTGGGSGARGAEIKFPTPQSNPNMDGITTFSIEFDWTAKGQIDNYSAALGLTVFGSNSDLPATPMYYDIIFGLYVINDGFIHYWNKDISGPLDADRALAEGTNGQDSLVFTGTYNSSVSGFGRAQYYNTASNPIFNVVDFTKTQELNTSTLTNVTFTNGNTYHVKAELNFATQQVVYLIITDNADAENTDSISTMPFCSPAVTDLALIDIVNTRGVSSSATNSNLDSYLDNLWIYGMEEAHKQADVTIKYLDNDGVAVKPARVAALRGVGLVYSLLASDEETFITSDGLNYCFFDADATHAANAAKGADGESLTVADPDSPGADNSLTVVFKKVPVTAGTYVWSGDAGYLWNYLDNNFKVAGGSAISYQPGNAAEFSRTDVANKEISVDGIVDLGVADMTVSAPDYTFSGTGKIIGSGSMIINAPVTLAANNLLSGGATVTAESVDIQSAMAATSLNITAPATTLVMEPNAYFNVPVNGAGGTLNMSMITDNECASLITGFSTVNISFAAKGRETSNNWTNPFSTNFDAGTQVNIIDAIVQDPIQYPATYAITATSAANAKVNLGDNTRIIFNGTPGANSTTTVNIGELTGTAGSSLQGNCVGAAYDRIVAYSVGALNTDAVFNGSIIPQLTREPARRSGTKNPWAPLTVEGDTVWYLPSTIILNKVGTGTWTLGGKIIIPDADSPSGINVNAGTLELLNSIEAPNTGNLITLTVTNGGTLKTHGNYIGAFNVVNNGTVIGGAEYANLFSMTDPSAVLKLNVNSFAAGDYDVINTAGDIAIKSGTLDITVAKAPSDVQKIVILESESNYDILDGIEQGNVKVLVNGEDITDNTATMAIPAGKTGFYYFDSETGTLGVKGVITGLSDVSVNKVIKTVEYYNILGQKVLENNAGVTLKKITYTDKSVETVKVLNRMK